MQRGYCGIPRMAFPSVYRGAGSPANHRPLTQRTSGGGWALLAYSPSIWELEVLGWLGKASNEQRWGATFSVVWAEEGYSRSEGQPPIWLRRSCNALSAGSGEASMLRHT